MLKINAHITHRYFSYYFSYSGYDQIIEVLVEYGANVSLTMEGQYTPLLLAAINGKIIDAFCPLRTIDWFNLVAYISVLIISLNSISDRLSSIELLVEAGSDVDARDYMNHTSLYHAIDLSKAKSNFLRQSNCKNVLIGFR